MHTASEPIKPLPAQKELRSLEGEWVGGAYVFRGPESNGSGGEGDWAMEAGEAEMPTILGAGRGFFAVTILLTVCWANARRNHYISTACGSATLIFTATGSRDDISAVTELRGCFARSKAAQ